MLNSHTRIDDRFTKRIIPICLNWYTGCIDFITLDLDNEIVQQLEIPISLKDHLAHIAGVWSLTVR